MSRVALVTDSSACIPNELAQRHQIEVIPLFLAFADRSYQDGMTEDSSEFYELLRTAKDPPTTSAPSPGLYAETFERLGREHEAVLCVTVSRQFSAIYDAATQGAELARERAPSLDVRVLDSEAAAMSQGFIVLEAARAAQEGADIDEVVARARAMMPRTRLLMVIDTLTYLARSGRVPRLIVWASSPLQVKPVVEFQGGKYRPVALVRTKPRALDKVYRLLANHAGAGPLHVCVHHTNVPREAEALAERVRANLQPKELFIKEFSQAMGVHAGPGMIGFAFYSET